MKLSKISLSQKLPTGLKKNSLLIYDKKLLKLPFFKKWTAGFSGLSVAAGEDLKSLDSFPQKMKKIIQLSAGLSNKDLTVIAVGGGSVGDFAGFVASILKRGVRLYHIPSTWLAAIDSSHGGKTALNVGSYKNQIGSFYAAEKVFLVKELLQSQPEVLAQQALSELVKISLINGGKLHTDLIKQSSKKPQDILWRHLLPAVEAKYKVVKKDPYEKSDIRQVLNLGHTVGHFYEAHFNLSHGEAVAQGLFFSLNWSLNEKLLTTSQYKKLLDLFEQLNLKKMHFPKTSEKKFLSYILQDKKMTSKKHINFVFLTKPGHPLVKAVSVKAISQQAKEFGIIR